jgi:succinyl-CoA synthetase beta subunit
LESLCGRVIKEVEPVNLLEYEAKGILQKFTIPIPDGAPFRQTDHLPTAPIVLKSQVHTGGRGKAGGVVVVREQSEVETVAMGIFGLAIKDEKPQTILAEELLDITHEYYLSVVINRATAEIELVAHTEGGIEIESHGASEFLRKPLTADTADALGETLAEFYDLPGQVFALQELVKNLYECFVKSDAILLEINPLVLTADNKLVAGDCKMTLDDDAMFRHPEWQFEQAATSANFVTLNTSGTVATIANGAGLAMATVDAVRQAGLTPANFLDIGGGATVEGIVESFQKILEFSSVNAIVINIFGGIVHCDDVAKAILEARKQFTGLPGLYIRLSGNKSAEATELLADAGLTLYPDLPTCLEELTRG